MLPENRVKIAISLKKARGMLDKIEKMLEDGKYCADVAQQINATVGLLKSANASLLENHLRTCGVEKIKTGDPTTINEFSEEIMKVWSLTQRS